MGLNHPSQRNTCFQSAEAILVRSRPELIVSKRRLSQMARIELVRERRSNAQPCLGFASRPFVLCGLPIKKPKAGELLHERRTGHLLLQVTGYLSYGLPYGQDRLVPIFLATLAVRQRSQTVRFNSAAEMLDTLWHVYLGRHLHRPCAAPSAQVKTRYQRIIAGTLCHHGSFLRVLRTELTSRHFLSLGIDLRIDL